MFVVCILYMYMYMCVYVHVYEWEQNQCGDISVHVQCMLYHTCTYRYYISTKHEQSMVQAMEEGDDALVKRLLTHSVEAFKAELIRQGSTT